MNIFYHIKKIEASAYPLHMQQMQHIHTLADLADYCEGMPDVIVRHTWYAIVCRNNREIVDIAAVQPLWYSDLLQLRAWLGVGEWYADLRASTSGRLVQALASRGWCTLHVLSCWSWGGEEMWNAKIITK